MAKSFPEPVMGTDKRPPGQGCTSCVHNGYCPTFYWYLRYTETDPDSHVGTQCNSWSNDENDRIKTYNEDDLEYNQRLNDENLLIEPKRNGADDTFTNNI